MSLVYIVLCMHLPLELHPDFGADDGWFYNHARFLVAGRWFGPYSQMTLMKGPGYPFFLAINYVLGFPLPLSHALIQIVGCAVFAWGIRRVSGSALLAGAIFTVCLWHPYLISSRAIRDAIYGPQALILAGCLLLMFTAGAKRERLIWAVLAGLSFSWLWLTREEGVWVLPGVGLLCLAALWRDRTLVHPLWQMGLTTLCAFVALAAGNFAAYRTWAIVDFKGGGYSRAVNALGPYLEGAGARPLMNPGCQLYPTTCGDYAGGWFIWVLRDAAAWAGAYRTPADADRFYSRMASEITSACRSGRLSCSHTLIDFLPQITATQWRSLPSKLVQLSDLVLVREPALRWNSSGGDALREMAAFIGFPRRRPTVSEALFKVEGWYRGPAASWVQVRCGNTVIPVEHEPSADVAQYFHDPSAGQARFDARVIGDACGIQLQGAATADPAVSTSLRFPTSAALAGGQLFIDRRVGERADWVAAQGVLNRLVAIYKILTPAMLAAAAASYLIHLLQLARGAARPDLYWWTTHALWLLVVTRCAILTLVDISSFPGITVGYLGPVFPLVLSAGLLTIGLPFRADERARQWLRAPWTAAPAEARTA